ncbi:MAG: site-specific integrase [Deltaproteobacteria bacterium]|nr:MAG: site-specific integrase [Deltaproteobacteria bacterium]
MAVLLREKKKGSGEWWVFINHKGKRRSKKVGDKRAANAVKREVETRLARGELGMLKERCPTVSNYGNEWLSSPLQEWGNATRKTYEAIFRLHIKLGLGSKPLDEVKRRDVKALIARLKDKGLSSSRMKVIIAALSGMFENAVEDELIEYNPCKNTRKHCGNSSVVDIEPLTANEVDNMLEKASELPQVEYAFFLTAARTGLRVGELLALEWTDFDFEERTTEINKNYNYRAKQIGPPKNKKTRSVDLTPATVEALRSLRKSAKVLGIKLVFTDETGKRLDYQMLYKKLQAIAPKPIRMHDLRHTYATLRIAKGDNILDVSKQLGHHSVAFTLDRYGHWMPGEYKSQVDELDNLHLSAP